MKKILKLIWKLKYLILGAVIFCALDAALTAWAPVENSTRFAKNDYEKCVLSHGGETNYDKVLIGSSTLVNSYIERLSTSGYVNFGIAYGTVCDFKAMLEGGYLDVREELVLNMADLLFYDDLETNPTYPWNRGKLEPYVYFQRDRLAPVMSAALESFVKCGVLFPGEAPELDGKYVVYGQMTEEELQTSIDKHRQLYWGQSLDRYQENLEALAWIAQWCADNGVRFRAYWSPWNPVLPIPDNPRSVMDAANEVLAKYGVETVDMTDALGEECFYDLGHLNQEYGAVVFTEVLDKWLVS